MARRGLQRLCQRLPTRTTAVADRPGSAAGRKGERAKGRKGIPVRRFVVYVRGMLAENDWPTLKGLQRRYIDRALEYKNGNKTRAAMLLGIDRRTLNRILARERALNTAPVTQESSDATHQLGEVGSRDDVRGDGKIGS